MNEVTIGISSPQELSARFLKAWETGQKQGAYINFESDEQFWKTLTLERWQILKIMTGAGDMTINEIAQQLNRDIRTVQNDIEILCVSGLLETTEHGVIFPYDAVHVDFMLKAA
jgi:predicted transcriptional regulator